MRNALDASFSLPVPELVAQQGFDMLVYTGNARPSQQWCDECAAHGVIVTFIQETDPNAAQGGYDRARVDVPFAERRVIERGHGGSICYVVSDGNRYDPGPGNQLIASYGQGVADLTSFPFFFYGNRYAVDAANEGAARSGGNRWNLGAPTGGGWVPVTWLYDPARDLIGQEIGYYTAAGGTCDVNTVNRPYHGGDTDDMSAEAERKIDDLHAIVVRGIPDLGYAPIRDDIKVLRAVIADGFDYAGVHFPNLYDRIAEKIDETCGAAGDGGAPGGPMISAGLVKEACKAAVDEALASLTLAGSVSLHTSAG